MNQPLSPSLLSQDQILSKQDPLSNDEEHPETPLDLVQRQKLIQMRQAKSQNQPVQKYNITKIQHQTPQLNQRVLKTSKQDPNNDINDLYQVQERSREYYHKGKISDNQLITPKSPRGEQSTPVKIPSHIQSPRSYPEPQLLQNQKNPSMIENPFEQFTFSKNQLEQFRVNDLEKQFGGYIMLSDMFQYELLRQHKDFQIIKYKDATFRGQIQGTDIREGMGIMVYDSGRVYEGFWHEDRRSGRGFEKYSQGNTYYGDFLKGKANGEGIYRWINGEVYQGQWLNGQKSGRGKWISGKGDSYEGEWKYNKANGKGEHYWSNGDRYEGDWMDFLKHGLGTDYFCNGDIYTGQYRYGKPCGKGKYIWASGAVYEGDFESGKKNGKGRWEKKQQGEDGETVVTYYTGEYVNDMKHGYGEYMWVSGNVYRGEYLYDKRHGYGAMKWKDGTTYEGYWQSGVQHGYGKMIMPNGEEKEGMFEVGQFKFGGSKEVIENVLRQSQYNSLEPSKEIPREYSQKQQQEDNFQTQGVLNIQNQEVLVSSPGPKAYNTNQQRQDVRQKIYQMIKSSSDPKLKIKNMLKDSYKKKKEQQLPQIQDKNSRQAKHNFLKNSSSTPQILLNKESQLKVDSQFLQQQTTGKIQRFRLNLESVRNKNASKRGGSTLPQIIDSRGSKKVQDKNTSHLSQIQTKLTPHRNFHSHSRSNLNSNQISIESPNLNNYYNSKPFLQIDNAVNESKNEDTKTVSSRKIWVPAGPIQRIV